MKGRLAWICYDNLFNDGQPEPEPKMSLVFSEPESWQYSKIVPIVYFELENE